MLRELARDLWVVERPQRFYGLEVGTRMTVIRLSDGSLLLHSPVCSTKSCAASSIRGETSATPWPRTVSITSTSTRWRPRTWGADMGRAGIGAQASRSRDRGRARRRSPPGMELRGGPALLPWVPHGERGRLLPPGEPHARAVRPRFNFGPRAPRLTCLVARLLGSYQRFGPSRLDPLLIRDRAAARRCMERILGWDFDRVVVARGEVLESGGCEALRCGYAWLLTG